MRSPAMGGRVGIAELQIHRLHLGPWLGMKHDWGWRHYKLKLNEVRDFTLFSVLFFSLSLSFALMEKISIKLFIRLGASANHE